MATATKNKKAKTKATEAVTAQEIARRAGVSRSAVSNWAKRYEGTFPAPLKTSALMAQTKGGTAVAVVGVTDAVFPWDGAGGVAEWLEQHNQTRRVSPTEARATNGKANGNGKPKAGKGKAGKKAAAKSVAKKAAPSKAKAAPAKGKKAAAAKPTATKAKSAAPAKSKGKSGKKSIAGKAAGAVKKGARKSLASVSA